MSTEGLHNKTGVFSIATIDTILPQPRFYELYDIGTGPLYGNSVQSAGTTAVIEAACSEVHTGPTAPIVSRRSQMLVSKQTSVALHRGLIVPRIP